MKKINRGRLSIDISPEEHQKIKVFSAHHGKSIKEYVLECLREQFKRETEDRDLYFMTDKPAMSLRELWNNDEDSEYDKL